MPKTDASRSICDHNHPKQALRTGVPVPCLLCGADLEPTVGSGATPVLGRVNASLPGVRTAAHQAYVFSK